MSQEQYLTLSEVAKRCPGRPHAATIWRWCRRGVMSRVGNRIRLQCVRAGGKLFVEPNALNVFFRAVADADSEHFNKQPPQLQRSPRGRTSRQRQRDIRKAELELRAAGIIAD